MDFRKTLKNTLLVLCCFFVGLFSVFISNLFWGYYGVGFAIWVVLFTIYVLGMLREKVGLEDKINIYLMIVGLLFQLLFFIANDIFSVTIYKKNELNFWSCSVLVSQVYSCAAIVYVVVKMTFSVFSKKQVEIFEKIVSPIKNDSSKVEENLDDLEINNDNVETIKSIPVLNMKPKTFKDEEFK